jgi:TolB-like protein
LPSSQSHDPRNAVVAKSEEGVHAGSDAQSRPSIAVLPFRLVGAMGPNFPIARGAAARSHNELSRLHWLFVIARGSSFRFRGADATLEEVRSKLNVQYCLTGIVEISGKTMSVSVELGDTQDRGIIWGERFRGDVGAVHEIRDSIINAVTSAVEVRIPFNEAQRARLKSPENLDAWAAYHLGLQHMYRFNKPDNDLATSLFERAIKMEPGFARAYAGLSFTHFQSAFLRYADDTEAARLAKATRRNALSGIRWIPWSFTMGRAQWLRGDLEASIPWLERANVLNQTTRRLGIPEAGRRPPRQCRRKSAIAAALALSPLRSLRLWHAGWRAMSHLVLGEPAQAAPERAAANFPARMR